MAPFQTPQNATPSFLQMKQEEGSNTASPSVESAGHGLATMAPTPPLAPSLGNWGVQAKLEVGAKDDAYEQEADMMADKVVSQAKFADGEGGGEVQSKAVSPLVSLSRIQRSPNGQGCNCPECQGQVQRKALDGSPRIQRKAEAGAENSSSPQAAPVQRQAHKEGACDCPACNGQVQKKALDGAPRVQRKAVDAPENGHAQIESRLNSSKGGGSAMPEAIQRKMEEGFGADFSNVRIHNGGEASQLSNDLGAKAFAHGNDIYFNQGQYSPESQSGQHLLAHELTHTIQQGAVQQKAVQRKKGGASVQRKAAPVVQRAEGDTTYYFAAAEKNGTLMRVRTSDNKFPVMNEGKVKKGGTPILDPANAYKAKEGEGSTIAADTKGTWYVNPDNATVALFTYAGAEAWVSASALSGKNMGVTTNDRVTLLTDFSTPVKDPDGKDMLQITWGSYTAWTAKSNLSSKIYNSKYSTPLSADQSGKEIEHNRGAHGNEAGRKASRGIFEKGAPNAIIKKDTAESLNKLPKVNNGSASTRTWNEETQAFVADGGKLTNGKPVVIKEERLVAETKGSKTTNVWYAKVVTHEGVEAWTWAGNEDRGATKHGNMTLEAFSSGQLDQYTNETFRAALATAYSASVVELLSGKSGFTAAQQDLFKEAMAFIADGDAQAKVSSSISIAPEDMNLEGNTLNADLISRVKLFHKFMVSKDLVTSANISASDGVRSAAEAHKWSTAYYIRQGSIPFSNIKALTGGKDEDGNQWYVPAEDDVMKEVPLNETELADEKAKQTKNPSYKPKTTKSVLDEAATMEKLKVRAHDNFWDGALAAEGYPSGSSKRKPNLASVGISNHVSGNAIDITIPFKLNYFDPVIDGLAAIFGLFRAVKDANAAEHWHYERVGVLHKAQVTSPAEHNTGAGK